MRFGPVATAGAEGAILAHATAAGERRLKKGHAITADDVVALLAAGVESVVAAVLEPGDIGEDEAARRIAAALRVANVAARAPATGRVNLHATVAGVFAVDPALVDTVNAVDPAITLATLPRFARAEAGQMVATVKIIPFAVAGAQVEAAEALCRGREAFRVAPFRPLRAAMVQTVLPGIKPSVLDKTVRVTRGRLERIGARLAQETRTAHREDELAAAVAAAAAGHDLVLVFGASAVSDASDVVPAAVRRAGGRVERFGMPVDPGNLLVLGSIGEVAVIGAPGCARSPRENGFDWILERIAAGVPVAAADIAGMGVGGLLMEIATRPQPREAAQGPGSARVHAVLLAAGRSSRMGGPNKLLARLDGEPLVRRTAARVAASRAASTLVVTGHEGGRVRAALAGLALAFADNPGFASGLAGSLRAGIAALPPDAAGAMIVLADMPDVTTADLDRLVAAFEAAGGEAAVRATHAGRRGNPVILPRSLFAAVAALEGDTGARHLVEGGKVPVVDVEIGEAASLDLDTPDALAAAGGVAVP